MDRRDLLLGILSISEVQPACYHAPGDTMDAADTIAAISTPLGEGGIGVVRVSGPAAVAVAAALFRGAGGQGPETFASHTAHYGRVVEPGTGEMIDECVLTLFRGPHSY